MALPTRERDDTYHYRLPALRRRVCERGPGRFNWNPSLFKDLRITQGEGPGLQLRAESYNTFNHTQWNNIDTGFTYGNFGQVTSKLQLEQRCGKAPLRFLLPPIILPPFQQAS